MYDTGQASIKTLRVYFASFELKAIREAAGRVRRKEKRRGGEVVPRYRASELARLTGLDEAIVRRECRRLRELRLVAISESCVEHSSDVPETATLPIEDIRGRRSAFRPVPVPRRMIRYLARSTQIAMMKTIVAYLVRGLTLDRQTGEVRNVGSVKASWIAASFGISLRSVKGCRKQLIEMGWLTQDETVSQWKLNRTGAFFRINLEWGPLPVRPIAASPADNSARASRQFAPRRLQNRPESAPPYRDLRTSIESRNQRTQGAEPAGVCAANTEEGKPRLSNVTRQDLERFSRVSELFRQAVHRRLINDSEASFLNWVSATVRARTCGGRDPVKVFLGIVKRKLWGHITQEDEDRARAAIRRYRYQDVGPSAEVRELLRMVA